MAPVPGEQGILLKINIRKTQHQKKVIKWHYYEFLPAACYACGLFSVNPSLKSKVHITKLHHIQNRCDTSKRKQSSKRNILPSFIPQHVSLGTRWCFSLFLSATFLTDQKQNIHPALHFTSAFLAIHPPSYPSWDNGGLRTPWAGQPLWCLWALCQYG